MKIKSKTRCINFRFILKHGKEAQSLKPGDVVTILTNNVRHWYGTKKNFWFSYIAIEVVLT